MKRITVIFLIALLCAIPAIGAEIDDLKADYAKVVAQFNANAVALNLLVEGFKASNPTFLRLVEEQGKLEKMGNDIAVKVKALETPDDQVAPIDPVVK
jgi:hypothetical protein